MEGLETASRDAQTLNLSPNVSKFCAIQVGSWMNEQQSQNFLLKVDPLSIIRKNKLDTQGEKIETAKLRVFVWNTSSSLPSVKSYEIKLFVSRISAP